MAALFSILFAFTVLLLVEPVFSASTTESYWTAKAPMQQARGSFGVATVNGKIYAIGGSNGSSPNGTNILVGTNEEYDPIANEWTFKKQMPTRRVTFPFVFQNKVYCIGGYSGNENVTGVNEVYNPSVDMWETKASMPTPRSGFFAVTFQNKIYCIGGYLKNGSVTRLNEVYDPLTDTWETKTSMLTPRAGVKANVANSKIYCIGGYLPSLQTPNQADTYLSINEVYDPATDSWMIMTPIPHGTSDASIVFENKIYVFAGIYENSSIESMNLIYNPVTDKWSQGTVPKSFIANGQVVATTGANASKKIYVLAEDFDTKGQPFRLHVYDPKTDIWTEGTALPDRRRGFSLVVVDDLIYAIGGYTTVYNSSIPFDWSESYTEYYGTNEQYTPFGYGTPDTSYTASTSPLSTSPPSTEESTSFPTVPAIAALLALIPIVSVGLLVRSKRKQKGTSMDKSRQY